jgi:hypothetical protein
MAGQREGLYNTEFGLALMVVLGTTVSLLAVVSMAVTLHRVDIKRQDAEADLLALNETLDRRVRERTQELENSLAQVKQLSGMLPICACCKKIRDDKDYWQSVEQFVTERTDARFYHGICPDCLEKYVTEEAATT